MTEKCKCKQSVNSYSVFSSNIAATLRRNETVDGIEYLVVPVVLAIANVEMNGAFIPEEELHAPSWNGRPVTLGHPSDANGDFMSASTIEGINNWVIGTILNAKVEDGKLKGEAFINVEKLNSLDPSVLPMLESEANQMDVSTGYYSLNDEDPSGLFRQSDVKPDHLAILPNSEGACNFQDGCGIRVNSLSTAKAKIMDFFKNLKTNFKQVTQDFLSNNARSPDDNFMQMVADLVSDDRSPFTADDWYGLTYLSLTTLTALRDHFLSSTSEPVMNNEETETPTADENTNQDSGKNLTDNESAKVDETLSTTTNQEADDMQLTDDDREALAFARNARDEHKQRTINSIVANSEMKADELKDFNIAQLETIANGLIPKTDYSARGSFSTNAINADEMADERAAMGVK